MLEAMHEFMPEAVQCNTYRHLYTLCNKLESRQLFIIIITFIILAHL